MLLYPTSWAVDTRLLLANNVSKLDTRENVPGHHIQYRNLKKFKSQMCKMPTCPIFPSLVTASTS